MNWLICLGVVTPLTCVLILWDACKNAPMDPEDWEDTLGPEGESAPACPLGRG